MVRAIDALVALTGNVGKYAGGARYGHLNTWGFNYNAMTNPKPEGSIGYTASGAVMGDVHGAGSGEKVKYSDRYLNINKTADGILTAADPKIKLLWVACKNPMAQDLIE